MKKSKIKDIIIGLLILATISSFLYAIFDRYFTKNKYLIINSDNLPQITEEENQDYVKNITSTLPNSAYIDMPFITQSPFATWDALHENACEEASLLIVKYWLDHRNNISKTEANNDIKAIVTYEEKNGYQTSIALKELNEIAKDYLNLSNGEIKSNITIENIKRELASNHPVIVGAAGKVLENPNFRNGGPNYHMLVITGYDTNGFIANDPGTRKGKDFRYTFENLFESIHDWSPDNILNGEKNYLVF